VYPPPDTGSPLPGPGPRWHPALAVPAVVVVTLVVPPLGAALAFVARWHRHGKAVTVVLASVWFVVLLVVGTGSKPARVDAEPRSRTQPAVVVVTVTASAPAVPAPVAASSAPTAPPPVSPPATASATPARTAPPGASGVTLPPQGEPVSERGRLRVRDNSRVAPPGGAPTTEGSSSDTGDTAHSDSGGGPSASYRNCTAVRQAGAAPIRRGDPGFGPHLDRDGDGVACE